MYCRLKAINEETLKGLTKLITLYGREIHSIIQYNI